MKTQAQPMPISRKIAFRRVFSFNHLENVKEGFFMPFQAKLKYQK